MWLPQYEFILQDNTVHGGFFCFFFKSSGMNFNRFNTKITKISKRKWDHAKHSKSIQSLFLFVKKSKIVI